jgi:PhoH-like ATPase
MEQRKTFILDTSVLLYDKMAIHSFPGNDVVIPLVVLDELDRFKDKGSLLGENARYVNRFLDELRSSGELHLGVSIENNQSIRVELNHSSNVPCGLDQSAGDNRIISVALGLAEEIDPDSFVTLVTKDINFRVKCDALGIKSEDYYKDKIDLEDNKIYSGYQDIVLSDSSMIDEFYKLGRLPYSMLVERDIILNQNEFICLKSESQSALCYRLGDDIIDVKRGDSLKMSHTGVAARNREQLFALNMLTREDLPLVTILGRAGSGKTFLTLMAGLELMNQGKFDRIVITRNIQPVGKDIGFLPGDINEKMLPWLAPIMDNFRQGLKDNDLTYFHMMRQKGQIEIAPLSFMRGRTFNNTFMILDEAQNATIHELKTVITRVGEGSKLVLLGDIEQIDTPYIDYFSNGLTVVVEKVKKESLTGHITLKRGERSKLATLAASII